MCLAGPKLNQGAAAHNELDLEFNKVDQYHIMLRRRLRDKMAGTEDVHLLAKFAEKKLALKQQYEELITQLQSEFDDAIAAR